MGPFCFRSKAAIISNYERSPCGSGERDCTFTDITFREHQTNAGSITVKHEPRLRAATENFQAFSLPASGLVLSTANTRETAPQERNSAN